MLVDLQRAVGNYLHDVFVVQLDAWIILGFVAQALFTMRFLVQWLASERAGRSVVPMAFWVFSIGGGILLFVYALYRRDPVFILGQGLGVFIYLRNLYFVLRERRQAQPHVGECVAHVQRKTPGLFHVQLADRQAPEQPRAPVLAQQRNDFLELLLLALAILGEPLAIEASDHGQIRRVLALEALEHGSLVAHQVERARIVTGGVG